MLQLVTVRLIFMARSRARVRVWIRASIKAQIMVASRLK
jgi:hypothetical protein